MKVDRLISIIMILLDKKRIGAKELAEQFEVSPRTIYRDIETINMAGIPICSTSGVGGGFEIMQDYKVDKKVFSTADLSAILMGLTGLSNMIRGDELVNALAKVKSFIPADRAKDIELKANQIYIDLCPWLGNRKLPPYLESIKTAIQEHRLLKIDYADRYGNETTRTVEPYQLVLKNSEWYYQGYCLKRNDYRLFKLSRISKLQILEKNFTPREYQKPQLEFNSILETMKTKVKLRVHKSILENILDFCENQNVLPDGDDYYIVNIPFVENDYNYDVLLSFGAKCECLEPFEIRQEIKRRIQDIAKLYEN